MTPRIGSEIRLSGAGTGDEITCCFTCTTRSNDHVSSDVFSMFS